MQPDFLYSFGIDDKPGNVAIEQGKALPKVYDYTAIYFLTHKGNYKKTHCM